MRKIVEDPVCHMMVPATLLALKYKGIDHAFCSEQCRERFLENPHLYVGQPGHKAAAQQGEKVIKRRRFVLSTPLDVMQKEQVTLSLLSMMGVQEVCIDGDRIEIQYDLIQASAEQIVDQLALTGATLGGGWVDRLKFAFINYKEECEIGSLEVDNTKVCH
ncbi:MAG: YHS domain-containing protein [Gallionella sp.]